MPKIHFGVTVPQIKRTWEEARAAATEFEALGYDSIWVCDHLYGPQSPQIPILEAWSLVSALAAVTSRVEIGTLVTPAGMRNPAHLGKVIATVDNIAGGRIIPGLGGGWMAREFTDFGVPFLPDPGAPRAASRDGAAAAQDVGPGAQGVTFEGKYVTARNVFCEPKPVRRPPILIGGAGEKVTLKIAARYADIWNNLAGQQHAPRAQGQGPARALRRRRPRPCRDRGLAAVPGHPRAQRSRGRADGSAREADLRRPHGRPHRPAGARRQRRGACASRSRSTSTSAARCSSWSSSAATPASPRGSSPRPSCPTSADPAVRLVTSASVLGHATAAGEVPRAAGQGAGLNAAAQGVELTRRAAPAQVLRRRERRR